MKKRENNLYKIVFEKKFLLIIIILVTISIISYFVIEKERYYENVQESSCLVDQDCVSASCCQTDSCVNIENTPDCSNTLCDDICMGTLSCEAISCKCFNNKCKVVKTS